MTMAAVVLLVAGGIGAGVLLKQRKRFWGIVCAVCAAAALVYLAATSLLLWGIA